LKLENVLVATDFSPASKLAMSYAMSIARRHGSRLLITHVVNSQSESTIMEGWRTGQAEVMDNFIRHRLDGIEHELLVKPGDVWPVLAVLIAERAIDLVVIGTHGRTGVRKFVLGSVAEKIFRQCSCLVLTIGPNVSGQDPQTSPERILAPTGFAAHSLRAIQYAVLLAEDLHASLGLLHVVTEACDTPKEVVSREKESRLRSLIPDDVNLVSPPQFFVEFGSITEKILTAASNWKANLIVLGLRHVENGSQNQLTCAKAYETVCRSMCPVITIRSPE
jgi:nucleotide-binding universal stress UspA family protein